MAEGTTMLGWLKHYAPRAANSGLGSQCWRLRREHGQSSGLRTCCGDCLPGWVKGSTDKSSAHQCQGRKHWRRKPPSGGPGAITVACYPAAMGFLKKAIRIGRNWTRRLFWLAGLWDRWVGPDGSEVETCCVITTEANAHWWRATAQPHARDHSPRPRGALAGAGDGAHRRALEPMLDPWPSDGWSRRGTSQLSLF